MPSRSTRLTLAASVVLAVAAPTAVANDISPISGGTVSADAAGDSGTAPDLRAVTPFADASGQFGLRITLGSNALRLGAELHTFIEVDGDPDTGVPIGSAMGADAQISVYKVGGGDHVSLSRISPDGGTVTSTPSPTLTSTPSPTLTMLRSGTTDVVWIMSAAELGVAGRTEVTYAIFTNDSESFYRDSDSAPDRGASNPWAFTGTIGSLTGPWPAFGAPAAPALPAVAARPPFTPPIVAPPARAPRFALPGFGLRATRSGVGLTAAWRGGAGPVTWTLRLEGRRDGRRLVRVRRGSGVTGPTAVLVRRTVPVPAAWRGTALRATFRVTNGSAGTITRVRMIRLPR